MREAAQVGHGEPFEVEGHGGGGEPGDEEKGGVEPGAGAAGRALAGIRRQLLESRWARGLGLSRVAASWRSGTGIWIEALTIQSG